MKDIRTLFYSVEQKTEDLGSLYDYGLCLDFVEAGTFENQKASYHRYQLSWGGPSDEFRIYLNGDVEYWYLDWFDGAYVNVTGEDAEIIKDIINFDYLSIQTIKEGESMVVGKRGRVL